MTETIRARPTTYRSTDFRSRLEARWAAFFDLIDWRWTYEPFETGHWIPDFIVHGDRPLLIEVGPVSTEAEYVAKAAKAVAANRGAVLVAGVSPVGPDGAAGLLTTDDWGMAPFLANWTRCGSCGAFGVDTAIGAYNLRPCGHRNDPHDYVLIGELEELWAEAGNLVKWMPERFRAKDDVAACARALEALLADGPVGLPALQAELRRRGYGREAALAAARRLNLVTIGGTWGLR
jgi:hypothetical protein